MNKTEIVDVAVKVKDKKVGEVAMEVEKTAAKETIEDIDKKKRKRENKLKKMQHQALAASRKLSRQRKKRNRLKKQHRF